MTVSILIGHVLDQLGTLADESVHMVVTSPPYFGLRAYGTEPQLWPGFWMIAHQCPHPFTEFKPDEPALCSECGAWRGELGMEPTVQLYIDHLIQVFAAVHRVLRRDGTVWLNIGDTYASRPSGIAGKESRLEGSFTAHNSYRDALSRRDAHMPPGFKHKDLMLIPARVAIALQEWGWWVRQDIIWAKPNPMPGSMTDRCTSSHEYLFLLAKDRRYFYDNTAILEPFADGRMGADYPRPNAADKIKSPHGQGFTRRAADPDGTPRGWTDDGARGSMRRGETRPLSQRNRGGRADDFTKPSDIDPSANGGRNRRSVWTISTEPFPEAHFAVFPTEIARLAILAGTSAHGVCSSCRAPWRRVTGRSCEECGALVGWQMKSCASCGNVRDWMADRGTSTDWNTPGRATPRKLSATGKQAQIGDSQSFATGWGPACDCNAAVAPAIVLDPFLGSGTTAVVCDELGRDAIGIELNEEYAAIARRRIDREHPEVRQLEGDPRHSAVIASAGAIETAIPPLLAGLAGHDSTRRPVEG